MDANTPTENDCLCGCGKSAKPNRKFISGYEQKLRAAIEKEVGGLEKLKELVEDHIGRPVNFNTQ